MSITRRITGRAIVKAITYPIVGSGEGGVSALEFHALDTVGGSFSADVIVGTGSITEARTSTIYLPDDSNVYQSFASTIPGEYYAGAQWWLYAAPALTNSITFSRDLTDSSWTSVEGVIRSYDQVGLTGVANTATYLEDNNGFTFEYVQVIITVTADTNTHTGRWFVKKDTDETRFPLVGSTFGAVGSAHYQLNTKTGAITGISTGGSAGVAVRDAGDWWEVLVSQTGDGAETAYTMFCLPANGDVWGVQAAIATGSIISGEIELLENKSIVEVRGSGPIFTAGSTATTNKTQPEFDSANHDNTQGGYYCEILPISDYGAGDLNYINVLEHSARAVLRYDGTNIESQVGSGSSVQAFSLVLDTVFKIGFSYGNADNKQVINVNGTEDSTPSTYTGDSFDAIYVGWNVAAPYLMRNLRRYNEDYETARITIDGLM